jgi:hypothetical protein
LRHCGVGAGAVVLSAAMPKMFQGKYPIASADSGSTASQIGGIEVKEPKG